MGSWEYPHKKTPQFTEVKGGKPEPEVRMSNKEYLIREHWIQAMEVRLVKKQLIKCQKTEGVNAIVNCRRLAKLYLQMLKEFKEGPNGKGNILMNQESIFK
ncbi:hypothetical protein Glove_227g52 [Diversispora epigaea]|uniref:NADH-ubiquinone oxidoreductase 12 kDa subunit n=1 Tax=Diversispora epigaea TaxID=1348612 RepID=A0A397IH67_9GLOM|nr:hypothetical protein Glove_227g52 [Diversispora epigaea]